MNATALADQIGMDQANIIVQLRNEKAALIAALEECRDVLGVIGAKYQRQIGPYATQAQSAGEKASATLAQVKV